MPARGGQVTEAKETQHGRPLPRSRSCFAADGRRGHRCAGDQRARGLHLCDGGEPRRARAVPSRRRCLRRDPGRSRHPRGGGDRRSLSRELSRPLAHHRCRDPSDLDRDGGCHPSARRRQQSPDRRDGARGLVGQRPPGRFRAPGHLRSAGLPEGPQGPSRRPRPGQGAAGLRSRFRAGQRSGRHQGGPARRTASPTAPRCWSA